MAKKPNTQHLIPAQQLTDYCNMLVIETIKLLDSHSISGIVSQEVYQEFIAKFIGRVVYASMEGKKPDTTGVMAYANTKHLVQESISAGFTGAMRKLSKNAEIEYYTMIRLVPEAKTKEVS